VKTTNEITGLCLLVICKENSRAVYGGPINPITNPELCLYSHLTRGNIKIHILFHKVFWKLISTCFVYPLLSSCFCMEHKETLVYYETYINTRIEWGPNNHSWVRIFTYPCNRTRRASHISQTIGWQMAVRLSALSAGRPLPSGIFLMLISVRGWVDPRVIVRLEGLGQLKNPMTSGIEPATFRLIA
jgi:hypothetical protein